MAKPSDSWRRLLLRSWEVRGPTPYDRPGLWDFLRHSAYVFGLGIVLLGVAALFMSSDGPTSGPRQWLAAVGFSSFLLALLCFASVLVLIGRGVRSREPTSLPYLVLSAGEPVGESYLSTYDSSTGFATDGLLPLSRARDLAEPIKALSSALRDAASV